MNRGFIITAQRSGARLGWAANAPKHCQMCWFREKLRLTQLVKEKKGITWKCFLMIVFNCKHQQH